jgi:hypothetical protein
VLRAFGEKQTLVSGSAAMDHARNRRVALTYTLCDGTELAPVEQLNDIQLEAARRKAAAMKEKGDKATYAFANPTSRVLGAMYKEKAGLQAIEVGYRTGADYLNELYSGKIDFAVVDNVQGMAQANAGRMLCLPSVPTSACSRRRPSRP